MLLIRDTFGLAHPERSRFDSVFQDYFESYKKLSASLSQSEGATPDSAALQEAVRRADEAFADWWAVEVAASRLKDTDPGWAQAIYEQGLLFLENIRKDYDRAGPRNITGGPLEANPKHANNLGNYAGFLLGCGRHEEGLGLLDRALAAEGLSENPALAAECWFYGLVHRPPEKQTEALKELKAILSAGGRSPGWNLGPHLVQAKARGRADLPWLEKLAAVISDGADIATLDGWAEWSRAS